MEKSIYQLTNKRYSSFAIFVVVTGLGLLRSKSFSAESAGSEFSLEEFNCRRLREQTAGTNERGLKKGV